MRTQKKPDGEITPNPCRLILRCFLAAVSVCLIWGLVYMPLKTGFNPSRLPSRLAFMMTQRDLARYILPENDTNLLRPNQNQNQNRTRLTVAVVVCSATANQRARNAIRETWARKPPENARVFFLVGTTLNASLNASLLRESERHGDIIQEDFLDTYNNLTVKSVMMLKWVIQSSSRDNGEGLAAKYVMKTDDDMFVNLPNLMKLLREKGRRKLLIGCLIKGASPVKDNSSKWFVPEVVFHERTYPPYLSGTGYVMSRDLVPALYDTALNTPFFYLEDIFITGVCARRAGIKPTNNEGFKFYKRKNDTCAFRRLITAHKMSEKELRSMWEKVHDPSIKCK